MLLGQITDVCEINSHIDYFLSILFQHLRTTKFTDLLPAGILHRCIPVYKFIMMTFTSHSIFHCHFNCLSSQQPLVISPCDCLCRVMMHTHPNSPGISFSLQEQLSLCTQPCILCQCHRNISFVFAPIHEFSSVSEVCLVTSR